MKKEVCSECKGSGVVSVYIPVQKELYVNDKHGCSCVVNSFSRVVTTRNMCPSGCRVVKVKEVK